MAKVRVPIVGTIGKSVRVNPDATDGATFGSNLFDSDGTLLTLDSLTRNVITTTRVIQEDEQGAINLTVFEEDIVPGEILARVADHEDITGAWSHHADITLDADVAVNWLDSSAVSTELLNFKAALAAGDAVIRMDFEDGTEGGTDATNYGSAGAATFGSPTVVKAAAAHSGTFGAAVDGGGGGGAQLSFSDGGLTDPFGMEFNDFTVHFRYRPLESAGANFIVEALKATATAGDWTIQYTAANIVQLAIANVVMLQTNNTVTPSNWWHIAFVKSGSTGYLFVDGVLHDSGPLSGYPVTAGDATEVRCGRFHTFDLDNLVVIKNQALWTVGFTPPVNAAVPSIFYAGDPAYALSLDGLSVNITAAATDIAGTLNVDGAATLQAALSVAGALSVASASTLHDLTILDATDADSAVFSHDGADFNTNFIGTTDWNITGISNLLLEKGVALDWLNTALSPVEMLVLGNAASADPDFANVSLLVHFDGTDAATTYTSEDANARIATFVAQAQLDTAQSKFGASSLLVDGTLDRVTFPAHADFNFGAGNFTTECWIRFNGSVPSNAMFAGQWTSGQLSWILIKVGSLMRFDYSANGSGGLTAITATWAPAADTWIHIAAVRTGSTMELFADGVSLGTSTAIGSSTLHSSTAVVDVGYYTAGGFGHNGWIDELRITKGVARYATSFTPDTVAFAGQGAETFLVGDPATNTQIDGLAISLTADTDVTGNLSLTGTVDGRDVASDGTTQDSHIADATIHLVVLRYTNAELDDITDAVNTSASKVQGYVVFNTDQGVLVFAADNTDGGIWTDGTGATVNTPV